MKRIRTICAALAVTAIGAFGGLALAEEVMAEPNLAPANLIQAKLPDLANGAAAEQAMTIGVAAQEAPVYARPLSGYAAVIEAAEESLLVKPEDGPYAGQEIQLNISDDSLLMSNKDTKRLRPADIAAGDRVYVYYDQAMTRSIPAQSHMQLLLADVEEGTPARLWTAEFVEGDVSGDMVITTDDGGLLLRVPQKAWQLPNDANDANAGNIKAGDRLIAWYDVVALSYPGQATAERAILLPAAEAEGEASAPDFAVQPAASVVQIQATVKEIQLAGEDKYLLVERANGEGELRLNFATEGEEAALLVDGQTGVVADWAAVKPGDKLLATRSMATTFSLPPQSWLHYAVVNLGENPPAGLYTVEQIEGRRLLVDNGGLWITLPENFAADGLKVGDKFLAWYDLILESYPGQTTASKLLPVVTQEDICGYPLAEELPVAKQAGKLVLDDMVFTDKLHYANGQPMVPLRAVAEELGFEVEWEPETTSVFLTNGIVRTNVYVGADIYNIRNEAGELLHEHVSFGAEPEFRDYGVAVPLELFKLLGAQVEVSADGQTIKIS